MTRKDEPVDPQKFIISRKRKLYKFALFHNSPICFEHEQWPRDWQPHVVEIGAGTGLFAARLAGQAPNKRFLAVDVKADRLQKGARWSEDAKLQNIHFLRTRADLLSEIIEPASLEAIWLTFPDPFEKARSAKRRLTHCGYLAAYAKMLKLGGSLCLKHDNPEFFAWSLEQLVASGWQIAELSFDLHESNLNSDYKTLTSYEERWLADGRKTHFARALPPAAL